MEAPLRGTKGLGEKRMGGKEEEMRRIGGEEGGKRRRARGRETKSEGERKGESKEGI